MAKREQYCVSQDRARKLSTGAHCRQLLMAALELCLCLRHNSDESDWQPRQPSYGGQQDAARNLT